MTLPITINLPLKSDFSSPDNIEQYNRDLVTHLTEMYENIANNVNGFIRSYAETDSAQWTPTLNGTTSGTFTYSHQIGWSLRQGILTQAWFDISWTGTTAAGNLYVELPYKVLPSSQMPFVGVIQDSSILYSVGYTKVVINAIPNSYRGEVWECGDNVVTQNKSVEGSGRIIGHIFYIGVEDE